MRRCSTNSARVLIVRKDFPANNYAEFVAYTKANPTMQYGSAGMGSGSHTCGILIDRRLASR